MQEIIALDCEKILEDRRQTKQQKQKWKCETYIELKAHWVTH